MAEDAHIESAPAALQTNDHKHLKEFILVLETLPEINTNCEIATDMGKRNKNRDNMTAAGVVKITDSNTENKEKVIQEGKQNKRRKNKPSMNSDIDASDKSKEIGTNQGLNTEHINSEKSDENCTQTTTHKNKKKRRETEMLEENTQKVLNESHNSIELSKQSVDKQSNEIPKQIKFGEDGEPQSDILKSAKEQSYLNDEEKAIQDDDIDQFCNDIDDEDNKQYESWISLLEQKLGSSDNNSTNKKNRRKKKETNKNIK